MGDAPTPHSGLQSETGLAFPLLTPIPMADEAGWFLDQVQRHESALRIWLRVRFPALRDHDDIVQESYLRMLRPRPGTTIVSPKAFLFATARNLALNQLRHRGYESPAGLGEVDASGVLDEEMDIAETTARAQELAYLREAIESLPRRCRLIFTLRRIQGLSQREIALRLRISEKTVEGQCAIAMRKCVDFFRRIEAPKPAATPTPVPTPAPVSAIPCLNTPQIRLG
jgi:RNA polymerase sigma factor (sigma-70 family)